ncbi:hypothetical protein V8E55_011858 [Tylopilus felleus]
MAKRKTQHIDKAVMLLCHSAHNNAGHGGVADQLAKLDVVFESPMKTPATKQGKVSMPDTKPINPFAPKEREDRASKASHRRMVKAVSQLPESSDVDDRDAEPSIPKPTLHAARHGTHFGLQMQGATTPSYMGTHTVAEHQVTMQSPRTRSHSVTTPVPQPLPSACKTGQICSHVGHRSHSPTVQYNAPGQRQVPQIQQESGPRDPMTSSGAQGSQRGTSTHQGLHIPSTQGLHPGPQEMTPHPLNRLAPTPSSRAFTKLELQVGRQIKLLRLLVKQPAMLNVLPALQVPLLVNPEPQVLLLAKLELRVKYLLVTQMLDISPSRLTQHNNIPHVANKKTSLEPYELFARNRVLEMVLKLSSPDHQNPSSIGNQHDYSHGDLYDDNIGWADFDHRVDVSMNVGRNNEEEEEIFNLADVSATNDNEEAENNCVLMKVILSKSIHQLRQHFHHHEDTPQDVTMDNPVANDIDLDVTIPGAAYSDQPMPSKLDIHQEAEIQEASQRQQHMDDDQRSVRQERTADHTKKFSRVEAVNTDYDVLQYHHVKNRQPRPPSQAQLDCAQ